MSLQGQQFQGYSREVLNMTYYWTKVPYRDTGTASFVFVVALAQQDAYAVSYGDQVGLAHYLYAPYHNITAYPFDMFNYYNPTISQSPWHASKVVGISGGWKACRRISLHSLLDCVSDVVVCVYDCLRCSS